MAAQSPSRWLRLLFGAALFFSALTGFAQMPIFKRYYIADIPGLGWLAQYYTTYALHYLSATLLMAVGSFLVVQHILMNRHAFRVTVFGFIKGVLLFLVVASGVSLVYRNLPGYRFAPGTVIFLNFSHLGLVMVFLLTALAAKIMKIGWTRAIP